MRSRKRKLIFGLLVVALGSYACDLTACNQILNPPPVPAPTSTPSPTPPPQTADGCSPVYSVGVQVEGHPNPLVVGEVYVLDVTPKGPGGEKLDPICHGAQVVWTITGPCAINGGGFNPRLICAAPGTMTAQACVSAPGGCGSVTLPVSA